MAREITGASDKPREQIRRYKKERLPTIAVTVEPLTNMKPVEVNPHITFATLEAEINAKATVRALYLRWSD